MNDDISGAGVKTEEESFEFMPAVSASSPSLGETCADSFVIPWLTFCFPNREKRQPLSSKFRFNRESRKLPPWPVALVFKQGNFGRPTVEHEIDSRLAQDEVLISEAVIQLRCTDAKSIEGTREHIHHGRQQ